MNRIRITAVILAMTAFQVPAAQGNDTPEVNDDAGVIREALLRALSGEEDSERKALGRCMDEGGPSLESCLRRTFFERDASGLPLPFFALLPSAARESVLLKTGWLNALKSSEPSNASDFRRIFNEGCKAYLKDVAQGLGSAATANRLCADRSLSEGGAESSTFEHLMIRFSRCASVAGGSPACAKALLARWREVLEASTGLGEVQADEEPSSRPARTLKKGGYTDHTLESGEDSDPVIQACKAAAIPSYIHQLELRRATSCVFEQSDFLPRPEKLAPGVREAINRFTGRYGDEASASNSALQNFLLQVRAAAIHSAARSLGEDVPVPRPCRGGSDGGTFAAVIQKARAEAARDADSAPGQEASAQDNLIAAAQVARELRANILAIDRGCRIFTFGDSPPAGGVGAPAKGVQCSEGVKERAGAYHRALQNILGVHPALTYSSDGDFDTSSKLVVLPDERLLKLSGAERILKEPSASRRRAIASELLAQERSRRIRLLGDLCDPSRIPTRHLLRTKFLVDRVLSQPGADVSVLRKFLSCFERRDGKDQEKTTLEAFGPSVTCMTLGTSTSVLATPLAGSIVGGVCFLSANLAVKVPRFLDALSEAERSLQLYQAGAADPEELRRAADKISAAHGDLVLSGVLSSIDATLISRQLRLAAAAAAKAPGP